MSSPQALSPMSQPLKTAPRGTSVPRHTSPSLSPPLRHNPQVTSPPLDPTQSNRVVQQGHSQLVESVAQRLSDEQQQQQQQQLQQRRRLAAATAVLAAVSAAIPNSDVLRSAMSSSSAMTSPTVGRSLQQTPAGASEFASSSDPHQATAPSLSSLKRTGGLHSSAEVNVSLTSLPLDPVRKLSDGHSSSPPTDSGRNNTATAPTGSSEDVIASVLSAASNATSALVSLTAAGGTALAAEVRSMGSLASGSPRRYTADSPPRNSYSAVTSSWAFDRAGGPLPTGSDGGRHRFSIDDKDGGFAMRMASPLKTFTAKMAAGGRRGKGAPGRDDIRRSADDQPPGGPPLAELLHSLLTDGDDGGDTDQQEEEEAATDDNSPPPRPAWSPAGRASPSHARGGNGRHPLTQQRGLGSPASSTGGSPRKIATAAAAAGSASPHMSPSRSSFTVTSPPDLYPSQQLLNGQAILLAQPDRTALSHQSAQLQASGGASSPDRLRTARGVVLRDGALGTASQSVASSPNAAIQRQVEVAQRTLSSLSSILSKYRKAPPSPPHHQPSQERQPQSHPGEISSEHSEGPCDKEPPLTSVNSPLESDEGASTATLAGGNEQSESASEGRLGSAGKAPAIVTVGSNSRPPAAYDSSIRRHQTTVSILEAAADLGAGCGTKSGGGRSGGGPGAVGLVRPSSPSLVRPLVLSDVLPPWRTL